MTANDWTVKTLHAVVDYLINESSENICEICCLCNPKAAPVPDGEEPCAWKRYGGTVACRNGVIEYFQTKVGDEQMSANK